MNVFTTDHPLWWDSPDRHKCNVLSSMLVTALILFPFVLGCFWFLNATDNGDTTGGPQDSFWEVFQCAAFFSLAAGFVMVALGRLALRVFRELRGDVR